MPKLVRAAAIGLALSVCPALASTPAYARQSPKKAIWGPVTRNGVSQFPVYRELGAGIYETGLQWADVAAGKPANPGDPGDPAYHWPAELDHAVVAAGASHMRVAIEVESSPAWANGGRPRNWSPLDPADFATFVAAAARRYPSVHLWLIWGEPSRAASFSPVSPDVPGQPLTPEQATGPHLYARLLDAAYGALKGVRPSNLVVGGDTVTRGDITPLNWIANLRLPDGHPPRLDLYGHNPISPTEPNFRQPPLLNGLVDFTSLPNLARWVDAYLARPRGKRSLRLFLSEYLLPTDHANNETNFWVDRRTQARWVAEALRNSEHWSRIYAFGWASLYDDPPNPSGDEVNRGLIDSAGRRKPAFYAYRSG